MAVLCIYVLPVVERAAGDEAGGRMVLNLIYRCWYCVDIERKRGGALDGGQANNLPPAVGVLLCFLLPATAACGWSPCSLLYSSLVHVARGALDVFNIISLSSM